MITNNSSGRFYVWAATVTVLAIAGATCFAQVDTDGDGFTDQEELYLGTNPNDASSYPGCITNSFGNATNMLYVAKNGSDSNPGTAAQPFLTIQKAMTVAQGNSALNMGSTVIVQPGAYRESVRLEPSGGVLHAPIVLQAATNGTATITGGDAWTNAWSLAAGSTNIYQHSWTNNWGLSPVPSGWPTLSNITRRSEIVIVNGNLYTQVESLGAMSNGTYFVDETNQLLNVQHLAGVVASNAFYEVTQRRSLLEMNGYNTGVVMSNLAVRGIAFRCAASLVESGAVRMINCKNILYENCSFEFNNWTGLYIGQTSNVTIRSTSANNNGTKGFEQYLVSSTVYDGVQTCFNNWRGAWGQFYGWALAGSKLLHIHRGLYRDYISYGNVERGMWFDTDCGPLFFERCTWNANLISSGGFGLFIEANQGPIRLEECVIAHNEGDWGLLANCTENVTVSNCVVYANGTGTGGQLGSSVNTSPRTAPDFETGVIHTNQLRYWNITDSVFSGLAATQLEVHLVNNLTNFLSTLTSDSNFWFNSATPNMFKVVSASYDLNGWQGLTGQDTHSSFLNLLVTNPVVQDAYINLGATTNNYGTATNAVCDTQPNGTGTLDVVLLKFDLSSLNNTPREAELQLAVTSILNNRPTVFNVYRLTTPWDENATGGQATSGSGWAAGTFSAADYDSQPYGIGGARNRPGLNTIVDVTALVQEWVNGTSPNYGLAIIAQPAWNQPVNDPGSPNWKQFTIATRESSTQSQRPQITSISRGGSAPPLPSANFTGSPTNGMAPLSVTFTDTSTGTIGSRFWDFGDNSTTNTTATIVAHTYGVGLYTVELAVSGPAGASTNTKPNYITVAPQPITLSPSTLPGGTVNVAYQQTISASGGVGPYTFGISSGALPAGFTLDGMTGILSGTPTNTGSATFTVQATDTYDASNGQSYTLVICNGAITLSPTILPGGTASTAYSQAITAGGGVGPYTFATSAGVLPTGTSLSSGGVLSGTLTAAGTYSFTVQGTDTNGCSGNQAYSVVVTCPTITATIAGASIGAICAGTPINLTANASGGNGTLSYAWTKDSFTFATTQTITDTPGANNHTYAVTVTDGNGCQSGSTQTTVMVNPSPTIVFPFKTDVSCNGSSNGTVTASFSGGTTPYQVNIDGGSLTSATSPHTFTGLSAGLHMVTVQDVNGCTAGASITVSTAGPANSVFLNFTTNTDFTANFSSNGGAFTWNATAGVGSPAAGGVTPPSSEATVLYKTTGWDMSASGKSMTISAFFKASSGASFPQINLGISTTTNGQFTSASSGSWLSFYLSDQSGLSLSALGYNYKNGATTSANNNLVTGIPLVNAHWYMWVVTFNNTSGTGTGTGSMTLTDYGTLGTSAGSILVNTSTSFGGTTLDAFQPTATAVYPGIRGRTSGPLAAFDNWSANAPCPMITLSPNTLPGGTAGTPYSQIISANGGAGAYTFAVSGGTLPPGLALNSSTGVLSGTPTNSGSFTFTVQAADANCCPGNQTYTVAISTADTVGDGIPDAWRSQYFGGDGTTTNNLSCVTCDADGTGQNNLFKYIAGLDPTNPSSVFALDIANVTNQPQAINLNFNPLALGRNYAPQFSTDLVSGIWLVLPAHAGPVTNGNHIIITDTNPVAPQKFYRIDIAYP